jgi:2-haloalkanoic acid dehalogenase type II
MAKKGDWPKAIFYDSKNTLWAWDVVWEEVCKQILKKYNSQIDPLEFYRMWGHFSTNENHRVAFSRYQAFTDTLSKALYNTHIWFNIPGTREDIKFMTDRWDEVQPFPDTIPALTEQKKITKVLSFSNVETRYLDMMVRKLPEAARPHFVSDMDKAIFSKPSPHAYRWVLQTASRWLNMDLNFSNVIYCAGVQWDVQGAMACGMKACWIRRPYRTTAEPEGEKPDYIINNLNELTKIVQDNLAGK